MKDKLIKQIESNFTDYKKKIVEALNEFTYKQKRYGVDFTLALFLATKELPDEFLQKNLRRTDKALQLDINLVAVIFDFTDETGGLKASENLLAKIEPAYFGERIFVVVLNSEDALDENEQARKALNILINEVENNFDRSPRMTEID